MAKEKSTPATPKGPGKVSTFIHDERTKFCFGVIILLVASVMCLGFVSFIVTGKADQAALEHLSSRALLSPNKAISNWAGTFGAVTSEIFINRWIGISAFLYIIFMFRLGYRLMRSVSIRSLGLTLVVTMLWSIWLSAFLGFVFVDGYSSTFLYLGGRHGYELTQILIANLGSSGMLLTLLASFILLCLFIYKNTIDKTRSIFNLVARYKAYRQRKKAEAEERARLKAEEEERLRLEHERIRLEAEAAAAFAVAEERERQRLEAEAAAAEQERLRLEAEAAAAEAARQRIDNSDVPVVSDPTSADGSEVIETAAEGVDMADEGDDEQLQDEEGTVASTDDAEPEEEGEDPVGESEKSDDLDAADEAGIGEETDAAEVMPEVDDESSASTEVATISDSEGQESVEAKVDESDEDDEFPLEIDIDDNAVKAAEEERLRLEAEAAAAEVTADDDDETDGVDDTDGTDVNDADGTDAENPQTEEDEELNPENEEGDADSDVDDFHIEKPVTETVDEPVLPLEDYDPTAELSHYQAPTFDLLKQYQTDVPVDMEEQNANKQKIKDTLSTYGIEIQSIAATVGPTITLFEIVLQSGTKISKVKNLSDEIAMCIASKSGIRIIAPIPGKSAIGIEVPNKDPQIVSMHSCITSKTFQETRAELPVVLGKTITNEVCCFDLAKMPHLLVAGATGQGKSVGLNAIITSLLYKKHPSQLKMVLVDPKQVEFSIYSRIEKHFLAKLPDEEEPIITDVSKVVSTLNSVCLEMEDRYALVKDAGLRNIKEYNEKFIHRELNPRKHIKAPNGSKEGAYHHYLPYMVVVVDEYGDLIMTAGKEIELPIARIAQKARAVGIHMIIATQRPSAKIITGIIKANFPARIAFRVGQAIDSSIILDQTGAQHLIGRGDLLFSAGDRFERVQCAFVDTPEVDRVNRFIADQQGYPTAFILPEPPLKEGEEGGGSGDVDLRQLDPMFAEAAELVVATGQGSTSMIQRKFSIGYNRAGRIMDQLEAAGIVGPYTGSKARAVIVDDGMELQNILADLQNR